jgi:hypothetical protein
VDADGIHLLDSINLEFPSAPMLRSWARQQRQKFPAPIPPASVRDNLLLGLRHRPGRTPYSGAVPATGRERAIEEARQSGNSELDITADWQAGVADAAALESGIVKMLRLVDLEEDV